MWMRTGARWPGAPRSDLPSVAFRLRSACASSSAAASRCAGACAPSSAIRKAGLRQLTKMVGTLTVDLENIAADIIDLDDVGVTDLIYKKRTGRGTTTRTTLAPTFWDCDKIEQITAIWIKRPFQNRAQPTRARAQLE